MSVGWTCSTCTINIESQHVKNLAFRRLTSTLRITCGSEVPHFDSFDENGSKHRFPECLLLKLIQYTEKSCSHNDSWVHNQMPVFTNEQ